MHQINLRFCWTSVQPKHQTVFQKKLFDALFDAFICSGESLYVEGCILLFAIICCSFVSVCLYAVIDNNM